MAGLIEFEERAGVIELAWGHPDPRFLPVRGLREASDRALRRYGPDALAYGNSAGPPPLIETVCRRLATIDARVPAANEVAITAGSSHGLDQIATLLMDPGDVALVEAPTYHLALRILRDHPVQLVPVQSDGSGLRIDLVAEAIRPSAADPVHGADLQQPDRNQSLPPPEARAGGPSGTRGGPDRRG